MPKTSNTPISSFKHNDKRVNIPPQELSGFMEDEEKAPKKTLYPRDPSLDPQLVWKGKDEQDAQPLEVPSVPIYIQEKIQPQVIVENVRTEGAKLKGGIAEAEAAYQMNMFADFNHIDFQDLVEFYQHEQSWTNRMVLGDSLLVMNSLAEKEGLKGKVQMIYMDPPYGIKFGSNWQSRLRKRDVKDGSESDLTREPEQVKAFRDTWELGIHSYLSYLRDRFVVARELLTLSGSIFIQIGDDNVHIVRSLLDEVFGSENFIASIRFRKKTMPLGGKFLERMGDFIIWYAKELKSAESKYRQIKIKQDFTDDFHWNNYELSDGSRLKNQVHSEQVGTWPPTDAKQFRLVSLWPASFDQKAVFPVMYHGKEWNPPAGQCYPTTPENMQRLVKANQIESEGNYLRKVLYSEGADFAKLTTDWDDTIGAREQLYVVETSPKVIERCMLMSTDPGDLVLDPTCGSGTTAFVAEQWGRRWITIDTSRVSIALARMRLMTAKYPYYLLADSPEGKVKESEITGVPGMMGETVHTLGDLRHGFVYQRVPHITLKSIANNEEIDTIYEKYQAEMELIRKDVNETLNENYEEWTMPKTPHVDSPSLRGKYHKDEFLGHLVEKWWELRRKRQVEIDASIARRADVELLYDKPYEDNKRIRVCGPFTVESLSPHRVLATDVERPESEKEAEKLESSGKFEHMIIANLRTAGVQNTKKTERLVFTRLEHFAGAYLQATGEYSEQGKVKRVAVCIGPEHGTVGMDLIREAAKEARQGIGFDLLVVLGFAFDPSISEEVKQYGALKVLPARINPDLMMGDLLKKTKNANLFTVFGEPDVEISKADGKVKVKLKGVDIFDPTSGEIRSSSPDEIACWFVDNDYNGESFFARQAYFCGMGDPYDRLKRALRAEVDEGAWNMLYRTESMEFVPPKGGKIAVKVINDYGDEVMKVFEV